MKEFKFQKLVFLVKINPRHCEFQSFVIRSTANYLNETLIECRFANELRHDNEDISILMNERGKIKSVVVRWRTERHSDSNRLA